MPPMKRHVLVALAALIPLATPSRAEDGGFRAGAAMSNITPLMGVPLDGTIMQIGPAKHVHDELWARCLAFDDGQSRLALVVVDCTMVSREVFDAADVRIVEQEGCQGRVAPRKQGEREEARLAEISEADEPKRLRQPPDFGIGVAGVAPYVHLLRPFACQHIVENRLAEELSDRQAACRDPCQDIRGRGRMQARAWIDFGDPARTGGVKIRVDVGVAGAYP